MSTRAGSDQQLPFMPPPPPKTPKSAGTRRRILEVAARLFIERGFESVAMRDVASAGGLSKGAVYGHFHSKGQLLVETLRWKTAERDHADDFLEAAADTQRGVALLLDDRAREIHLLEIDAAAAARHDPEVAAGLAELFRERHEWIRATMSAARDPDTAAWMMSILAAGIGVQQANGRTLPDEHRLTDAIIAMLHGLL